MPRVRVLVVDGQRAFAEALATRLELESDLRVVGVGLNSADALRLARQLVPDVVTVDVVLGADDGIELSSLLRKLACPPAVVLVSAVDDVQRTIDAVRAGTVAWVSKDAPVSELIEAVRSAFRGDGHLAPSLLAAVLHGLAADGRQRDLNTQFLDRLTKRERRVLELMVQGRDRGTIAAELFITANTVRTHVQNLLVKLGAHSSLEAVAIARGLGLGLPAGPGRPDRDNGTTPCPRT